VFIDFNFRNFQASDELITYVTDRFDRLGKFDQKSIRAIVVFSVQKHNTHVSVTITGPGLKLHAKGAAEDFFECVDVVSSKLSRQMERSKSRLKESRRKVG
jgi:ribosomal subunit interface protein